MPTVYTRSFGFVRGSAGQVLSLFQVPAYDTFVLREINFFYADPAAKYLNVTCLTGGISITLFALTVTGQATLRQEMRAVLPAGGLLRASSDHGTWTCLCTGYHFIGQPIPISQGPLFDPIRLPAGDIEGGAPLWSAS